VCDSGRGSPRWVCSPVQNPTERGAATRHEKPENSLSSSIEEGMPGANGSGGSGWCAVFLGNESNHSDSAAPLLSSLSKAI
jgi:hypothetical protein